MSNSTAHPTLLCVCPNQVVERFLQLRARLPADQVAQYCRQEHLNETDSQLLAQSLAEMVRAQGPCRYSVCMGSYGMNCVCKRAKQECVVRMQGTSRNGDV